MFCGYDGRKHDKSSFKAADLIDGGPFDFNYQFWVCAGCNQPTRMVFQKATDMLIPRQGTQLLSEVHDGEGIAQITWATGQPNVRVTTLTFHPYPFGAEHMHPGRSHLLMIWEKLDRELDIIMDPTQAHNHEAAKSRGGAFSEVIAQLMSPFYNSRDDVTREAVERYHARAAGTAHETPGLAEVHWNPRPVSQVETDARNVGATRTIAPVQLPDNKVAFIKHALETGSMDAKALADMFGVSIEVITAAVDG